MLGELENYEGEIRINGRIFYISQKPWIFPSTIRQNILFGNKYNKEKFDRIVELCGLVSDLESLPSGENTLTDEKGSNLTADQKVRISL